MKTANPLTENVDICVVMGDFVSGDAPRDEAYDSLKCLYTDLTVIREYYMRLGFHLSEFRACEYYKDFGYLTLEEFCDVNLGLDKGAVSRCINVYKQFNASNDVTYSAGLKKRGCAIDLSERWKDYSYTQLCEMLPLSDGDRRMVTPDMTVKQIRELKRKLKNGDGPVASTQPEEKKPFDKKKYDSYPGIIRQNAVRYCDALDDNAVFNVFDRNGTFLYGNMVCDLIYKDGHNYYFRLSHGYDDDGKMLTQL